MKEKNNKKTIGTSKNPIVNWFQAAWIWFKETAWIQVVLVVLVVFAVVFSIPFIVRAASAETDTATENTKWLNDRSVDYDELDNKIKTSKEKYTVVFFYSETDTDCQTQGGYLRDYVLNSKYFDKDTFENSFVTFDMSRTETNDEDDYDISDDQVLTLANIYKPFYDSNIYRVATWEYQGNRNQPLYTTSWDEKGNNNGELTIPAGTWVIYENNQDGITSTPVWINLGWNHLSSLATWLNEFEAAMDYSTDPAIINLVTDQVQED